MEMSTGIEKSTKDQFMKSTLKDNIYNNDEYKKDSTVDIEIESDLINKQNSEDNEPSTTTNSNSSALQCLKEETSKDLLYSKVKSLTRKNRNLSMAFENEKRKVSHLRSMSGNIDIKNFDKEKDDIFGILLTPRSEKDDQNQAKEVLVWKEKYNTVSDKLSQTRQKVSCLEQKLTTIHATFKKEVGKDVPVDKKTGNISGNWKGRAETIAKLQSKIVKLESIKEVTSECRNMEITERPINKIREEIYDMRKEKIKLESMLNREKDTSKKAVFRKKNLEKEMSLLRKDLKGAKEKSSMDQQLIKDLKNEVNHLKDMVTSKNREVGCKGCLKLKDQIKIQEEAIIHLDMRLKSKSSIDND